MLAKAKIETNFELECFLYTIIHKMYVRIRECNMRSGEKHEFDDFVGYQHDVGKYIR